MVVQFEVNCISDIEIKISLEQFELISVLSNEFTYMLRSASDDSISNQLFTYFDDNQADTNKNEEDLYFDQTKDSGVETTDGGSEIIPKVKVFSY